MLQLWKPKRPKGYYQRDDLEIICDAIMYKDFEVLKYYIQIYLQKLGKLEDNIKNFPILYFGSLIQTLNQFDRNEWYSILYSLGGKTLVFKYIMTIKGEWCDDLRTLEIYYYKERIYNDCIYYKLEFAQYADTHAEKMYYGNYKITEYKSTLAEKNPKLRILNLMILVDTSLCDYFPDVLSKICIEYYEDFPKFIENNDIISFSCYS